MIKSWSHKDDSQTHAPPRLRSPGNLLHPISGQGPEGPDPSEDRWERAQSARVEKVSSEALMTLNTNILELCSKKQKVSQLWLLLSVTKNNAV